MNKGKGILKLILVFSVIFIITCPEFGLAEEKEKKEEKKIVKLPEMVVIAPQPGVEITPEKTIIRMDEFKKPGHVRTLTDVLTEIGGVDVLRTNPLMASPGDEVSIRGLNEGRMVIEIDGRRINHTGHVGRYVVDWSTLNIDDVERIEIIRGGHSVLHPFAIGGVINIITKKGKKTKKIKPDISFKGGYGRYDTYNGSVSINGGLYDLIGYHFSASKAETDGYLRNNYQDSYNLNGHLTFFLPHEATLSFGVKYSDIDYGFPVINDPSRPDYDPDYPVFLPNADQLRHLPPIGQLPQNDPHWEKHTTYLDGILELPLGPGDIKLHGFWTEGRRWISMWQRRQGRDVFVEDQFVDDRTKGIICEYGNINFANHNLTVGFEYQELGWPDKNPIIYLVKSAYLQDVIRWKRWTIIPGVRYYKLDMDTYYSQFGAGWPIPGKEEDDSGIYPSFRVNFQATPKTALYAAVSRSYRLPCP
ncbi:MAG: TonB-dependent receptor [Deltaproteobacteria bacterium]|nr:TonB-dependent receptor [Deltaproteobacteria bacterium]